MSVCIIPARGGSKRIPNKNIKLFCGKPMIHWSIEAAKRADCFEHILVSTDSDAIASVALDAGAIVPFVRPTELADDQTATQAVMRHAVNYIAHQWPSLYDSASPVCCLYATAPFVQASDILAGCGMVEVDNYVLPVTSFGFPIQRAARITTDNVLAMFQPEHFNTRSQDLEEAWHDAGQFYWACAGTWTGEIPPYSLKTLPLKLPRWRVQDIDTPEDWVRAEALFTSLRTLDTHFQQAA